MKKLKIISVVGTRPEIIRLSRVFAKLDESDALEHISVHTGQNYDYELNQIFYKDLGIRKPDYYLDAAGESTAETIGRIIIKFDELLNRIKPDALLVLGDTNSCLVTISPVRYFWKKLKSLRVMNLKYITRRLCSKRRFTQPRTPGYNPVKSWAMPIARNSITTRFIWIIGSGYLAGFSNISFSTSNSFLKAQG